jgi:hypothetical protein
MKKDPVLDAIYKVRMQISAEYKDTKSFLDHYREMEKQHPERMLTNAGKKTKPRKDRSR